MSMMDPLPRARQLIALQRYEEALDLAQQALLVAPEDPDVMALMARALHLLGRNGLALDMALSALRSNPNHVEALITASYAALNQKYLGDAPRFARQALELAPHHQEALVTLVIMMTVAPGGWRGRRKRNSERRELADRLEAQYPFSARALVTAGREALARRDRAAARRRFERALALEPENSEAMLALARLDNGASPQAVELAVRAGRTNPRSQAARRLLQQWASVEQVIVAITFATVVSAPLFLVAFVRRSSSWWTAGVVAMVVAGILALRSLARAGLERMVRRRRGYLPSGRVRRALVSTAVMVAAYTMVLGTNSHIQSPSRPQLGTVYTSITVPSVSDNGSVVQPTATVPPAVLDLLERKSNQSDSWTPDLLVIVAISGTIAAIRIRSKRGRLSFRVPRLDPSRYSPPQPKDDHG